MECLKFDNQKYEGKIIKMSKGKNDTKKVIQISLGGVIAIVVSVAIAAISATWLVATSFGKVNGSMIALNKDIGHINTKLDGASDAISEI